MKGILNEVKLLDKLKNQQKEYVQVLITTNILKQIYKLMRILNF